MNRSHRGSALWPAAIVAAWLAACGSASRGSLFGEGSGGHGAADAGSGGRASSGGAEDSGSTGGAEANGGTSSSGGAGGDAPSAGGESSGGAGSGGALASGGANGDGGACAPPSDARGAALCIHFVPERIRARADARLDKMGVLVVQAFDGPKPGTDGAGAQKLVEEIIPGRQGEVSVDALPRVRFDGVFPETVYVRAVFVDNQTAFAPGGEGYGVWLGGADLSSGVVDPQPLVPLSLTAGAAHDVDVRLVALRRLEVKVNLAVTPAGDGEGSLLVTAVRTQTPVADTQVFGVAAAKCAKTKPSGASVTGFVIGSGTFYMGALLKDLGGDGLLPEGALASLDASVTPNRLPTRLVVGPADYATSVEVPLNLLVPVSPNTPIHPNSCADLGL